MDANIGYAYRLPGGGLNYKIRTTLSHFSELFSEFNKYIAPAYHHDRCERSVQMRVYSMHKGELVMVFVAFFACLGLGVFIGLAGPPPTVTTKIPGSTALQNSSSISEGPFHLHSPALGTRVQQLWLLAEVITDNNDEEIFDKSFQVSISIDGVVDDHTFTNIVPESKSTNKTRHLKCKRQLCEEVLVLHAGSLQYTHYMLNIHFYGLREFHKRYSIREVNFYFKTYNAGFTQLETWFRFIFLLATFVITCWFAHCLRKYSTQDWSIEQKWLSILLPLLLLYNDPLFPLRLVSSGCLAPLLDVVFQTLFLCCVLLSWLAQYHGLRQNERSWASFYLPKLVVVGMLLAPALVVAVWQKYYAFYDPTYDYLADPNYTITKFFFFFAVTVYFLYLLILVVRAYSELKNMPFFDVRLRCLSTMVGMVTTMVTMLSLQGWGAAALQDHWASQPKTHFDTSAPFMALYGLLNFKLYTMAYLCAPAPGSIHETSITKDNPAFSMINDSDEEVIYGSDEESRRPLTAQRSRTEESD